MSELVLAVLFLISNIVWLLAMRQMQSSVNEMAKMLASRTFSEYSIGQTRLAEKRREQKESEGYDSVF